LSYIGAFFVPKEQSHLAPFFEPINIIKNILKTTKIFFSGFDFSRRSYWSINCGIRYRKTVLWEFILAGHGDQQLHTANLPSGL